MKSKKTDLIFIVLLIAVTFGIYFNTLYNGFVYDDNLTIVQNYLLRNPNNFYMLFTKDYYGYSGELTFRPIVTITYYFDYLFFKLNPMWYHLENVLWHICVVIALYFLIRKILKVQDVHLELSEFCDKSVNAVRDAYMRPRQVSFFCAILFGVQTIHVEAVNAISYREDLLMTFFLLLSFITYLNFKRKKLMGVAGTEQCSVPTEVSQSGLINQIPTECSINRTATECLINQTATTNKGEKFNQITIFILSMIFCFFSMMSKETAIVLLPLIIIYDFLFERDVTRDSSRESLRHKCRVTYNRLKSCLKYYFCYLVIILISLLLSFVVIKGSMSVESGFIGATFFEQFLTGINIIGKYLFLMIAPFRLALDHIVTLKNSLIDLNVLLSLATILALIILIILLYKRKPIISFSILFFFVGILPTSNIFILQNPIGERYLYLPSIGFCLLISYLLIQERIRKIGIVWLILLVIYYGGLTIWQNRFWRDDYTVWSRVVEVYPDSSKGHMNLGLQLSEQGKFDKAGEEFTRAINLEPKNYLAYIGLGEVYMKYEQFTKALDVIKKGVELEPKYYSGYNSLGNVYYHLAMYQQAESAFKEALKINSYSADVYNNLGNVYCEEGKIKETIDSYKKAISLNPEFAEAYNNLGNIMLQMGRLNEAETEFKASLFYKPELVQARHNLATVYMNQKRWKEAARELELVVNSIATLESRERSRPFPTDISHYYLGIVYDNLNEYEKAMTELENAVKLNPNDTEIRNYLYSVKEKMKK